MNRATETKSETIDSDANIIDARRGMRVVGLSKERRPPRFTIAVADDVFTNSEGRLKKPDGFDENLELGLEECVPAKRRGSTIVPAVAVVAAAALIGYLLGHRRF